MSLPFVRCTHDRAWRRVPGRLARSTRLAAAAGALLLATSCGDDSLTPAPLPASDAVYWELVLDQHAALLSTAAPYDTLRITATPRNFRHEPLSGLPASQFRSLNPGKIFVSPDGLIEAGDTSAAPVGIEASLTVHNTKHVDTIRVIVVDAAAPVMIDQFSIRPVPPDSAKLPVSLNLPLVKAVTARVTDAGGASVPIYLQDDPGILPVYVASQDTSMLKLELGSSRPSGAVAGLAGRKVGHGKVIASTTAFGVRKADTVDYRVGLPLLVEELLRHQDEFGIKSDALQLQAPEVKIGVGGVVLWWILTSDTATVQFAEADLPNVAPPGTILPVLSAYNAFLQFWLCGSPDDCANGGGNVALPSSTALGSAGRSFPVVGTYDYRIVPGNIPGRVIVVDESTEP